MSPMGSLMAKDDFLAGLVSEDRGAGRRDEVFREIRDSLARAERYQRELLGYVRVAVWGPIALFVLAVLAGLSLRP